MYSSQYSREILGIYIKMVHSGTGCILKYEIHIFTTKHLWKKCVSLIQIYFFFQKYSFIMKFYSEIKKIDFDSLLWRGLSSENFDKLSLKNGASQAHFYNWKLIKMSRDKYTSSVFICKWHEILCVSRFNSIVIHSGELESHLLLFFFFF